MIEAKRTVLRNISGDEVAQIKCSLATLIEIQFVESYIYSDWEGSVA